MCGFEFKIFFFDICFDMVSICLESINRGIWDTHGATLLVVAVCFSNLFYNYQNNIRVYYIKNFVLISVSAYHAMQSSTNILSILKAGGR